MRQLFFISTSKPKVLRKSAPMMGWDTDAIMNGHRNTLRRFRSKVRSFSPKVEIVVPFAANSLSLEAVQFLSWIVLGGMTEISAPVSIKNRNPVDLSAKNILLDWPYTLVASSDGLSSFPDCNCKVFAMSGRASKFMMKPTNSSTGVESS
ncbi:hypothetical protein AVEN_222665-1 [Araneus ventricosus]|uniref:Uncharacterized protein n=1 Tax=Araneus ventricosus TaxID=182803 RepID=A0A4Y2N2X5_ARAVE|nr:hypothetical protein AVEN_222665-1 [Araneus ventricosus]